MKEIIKIETISQVHEIFGIGSPRHPLVSVLQIDDKIANFDYGDATYVFDFYQVSLKMGMSGSLHYGRNSYDFQEGTMLFTKPKQTLQIENNSEFLNASGWTLMFHPDLIRKSELGKIIDSFSFFSYNTHEALHLSEDERLTLTELIQKIEREYNQNIDKHSQELIIANIELLMKYCMRYYDRQFYTRTNMNKDILTKFEELVRNYYNSDKPLELGVLSVNHCAKELNMSPNYLGDMLKSETGKNAKDHITEYLIEKAKTQIVGSNESISEIAYSLGFEYAQNFNKLFKAKTGMSPTAYRNKN